MRSEIQYTVVIAVLLWIKEWFIKTAVDGDAGGFEW
jgi:hypothetical protein